MRWDITVRPSEGHFTCAGCGPNRESTGKPYMQAVGAWSFVELCLGCAAELRDELLRHTQQRGPAPHKGNEP